MVFSRREFLATTAIGAVAIAGPRVYAETDPWRGLKVGVHTYSVRKLSFEEAVSSTAGFGLKHIGFNPVHVPLESTPGAIDAAKAACAKAGLEVMAIGVVGFSEPDEKFGKQVFEFAKRMGMHAISANPEAKALPMLHDMVKHYDIRIAIHNHGPDSLFQTPEDVLRAVEPYDERIGACADIGHYERSNVRAAAALKALRGRVYDMHLKDVDVPKKEGKSVVLGTGIVDFEAVFAELLEQKFSGHIALEYEAEADAPLPSMKKCFDYAKSVLAKNA